MSSRLHGKNIIVLDLETARSANDCKHCYGQERMHHDGSGMCFKTGMKTRFAQIGWENKAALGLSIGGYYSYAHDRIFWFDEHTLEKVMGDLIEIQPLMVSFNGISFDFELMSGLLWQKADEEISIESNEGTECARVEVRAMCRAFRELAKISYDIFAEICKADPDRKFERGLNSLDAISKANALGGKLSHGTQAPRDWAAGRHADVINYCADDILKTKALLEMLEANQGEILRGDGSPILLPWISASMEWQAPLAF